MPVLKEAIERRDLRHEALQIAQQLPKDRIEAITVLVHCRQLLGYLEGRNFVDEGEMIERLRIVSRTG